MRAVPGVIAFGVGLQVRTPDVCSVETALEFFNYGYPVPADCVATLQRQATDWCRSYLSAEAVTVYLTTVTRDTPFLTISETSTTVTTTTEEM